VLPLPLRLGSLPDEMPRDRRLSWCLGGSDSMLVHAWDLGVLAKVGAAAALRKNVGIICSLRGAVAVDWKSALWLRLIARRVNRFVVSDGSAKNALACAGVPAERVAFISPGVECRSVADGLDRIELTRLLQVPESARLICAVGPLQVSSGYRQLIWAVDLLRNVADNVFLVIAGTGPDEYRLRRFCDQATVGNKVRFIGNGQQVRKWLAHFDWFWTACSTGRNSSILLEAMSRGLPVVATDIKAHRQIVIHGETGYLVAPGDRAAFTRYTWKLLRQPELSQQLGLSAMQRAHRHFSANNMTQEYSRLYAEVWKSVTGTWG
jgi:glycosyltransferase involved in cell wall biosynthesis